MLIQPMTAGVTTEKQQLLLPYVLSFIL